MIARHGQRNLCGIYEKALSGGSPAQLATAAVEAGYDFLELAIDESQDRLSRLEWPADFRAQVARNVREIGAPIATLTLSAQRRWPWGSGDPGVRARSATLARHTIDLAADLGAGCVQVPGYFTYYEPAHATSREQFVEGLRSAANHAATRGVVLALENMDGTDVVSVQHALAVVAEVPAVRLYLDVGNLAGNELPVIDQLAAALPHVQAIQLKDARPGEFRRVPFGYGTVPFAQVLAFLHAVGYTKPLSVEMWNDHADPEMAADARRWLQELADTTLAHAGSGDDCGCSA